MYSKRLWKKKVQWLAAITLFLLLPAAVHAAGPEVTATPFSMDFYGSISIAQPGGMVTVEDGDGVVCGVFTVKTAGRYGFVHVYGDDPITVVDEGARPGDRLTFLLNNIPLDGQEVIWLGDGQRQQVDFAGQ